jgi:murein DD-endopeptidase MepM/ murein hydrolase activator NlpD
VRRARRIVGLLVVTAVVLLTLLLTAFGTRTERAVTEPGVAPAGRLLPAGPPRPQIVAMQGSVPIQLPVPQSRLTTIGYHATADGALPFRPLGLKANVGWVARLAHRVFGGGSTRLRYFQLPGGSGPSTAGLDVGARVGTDVYAPVDGVIVALDDFILNGRRYGARIEIQPATAPSVVLTVSRLRPDPSLAVGTAVSAGTSKIGTVIDLSGVEQQALARYTQDSGNHVSLEVQRADTTSLP